METKQTITAEQVVGFAVEYNTQQFSANLQDAGFLSYPIFDKETLMKYATGVLYRIFGKKKVVEIALKTPIPENLRPLFRKEWDDILLKNSTEQTIKSTNI